MTNQVITNVYQALTLTNEVTLIGFLVTLILVGAFCWFWGYLDGTSGIFEGINELLKKRNNKSK